LSVDDAAITFGEHAADAMGSFSAGANECRWRAEFHRPAVNE
jgi:hypothetical protein